MKNLLFLGFAISLFSLSACKKDFTCTCTNSDGEITNVSHYNLSTADAESACENAFSDMPDVTCVLTED